MNKIDENAAVTPEVTAREAVAVIGVGAVMPDAPNAGSFWENLVSGRYSVREVPSQRWNTDAYFDPDPSAPDKTYSKIGAFVEGFSFDFKRFRIPPRTVEVMDPVQLWAMSAAGEALEHAGYLDRDYDRERTAVILGNSMSGELHYSTSARVLLPEVYAALEEEPSFCELPESVRKRIAKGLRARVDDKLPRVTEDSMPGELANVISGRVAQAFNLGGASYTVDAACASSLAAIDTAVNGLRRGEYDMVVTGGVDRSMGPPTYVKFCKIGALSAEGSYPFDARASGFVMGEGCAMFVLKRWSDAVRDGDEVLSLILGIGSSSDGKGKAIAAPNMTGQLRALRRGYEVTGVSPAEIDMIEAHGTSTKVGDPVEVAALSELFRVDELGSGKVALGSVKSQIGHLKSAAGAAAILKTTLALANETIVPSVNFESPNPEIDLRGSAFRIPTTSEKWHNGHTRRAAVSAFGFGGTNFHVILQEAPDPGSFATTITAGTTPTTEPKMTTASTAPTTMDDRDVLKDLLGRVAFLSAQSEEGLLDALRAGDRPSRLADLDAVVAFAKAPCRLAVACKNDDDLAAKIDKLLAAMKNGFSPRKMKVLERQGVILGKGDPMKVGFLFPGQGSQSVGMLRDLYEGYEQFRSVFSEADAVMTPILGHGLTDIVYPGDVDERQMAKLEDRLKQTEVTQPAMLAADIAVQKLLASAGVVPDMVVGHSLGEYAALMSAGVISLSAAMEIVAARGREMTSVSLDDPGRMVAAMADAETVEKIIEKVDGYLVPANKNSSTQTVVAGESDAVERLLVAFEEEGVRAVGLRVSHAFHSSIVAPASDPLRRVLSRHEFSPAALPVFTNVGGGAYPADASKDVFVDVLSRQIASPVEFVACIRNMYEGGARFFVEVGPRRVLASFAEDVLKEASEPVRVACSNNHRTADLDGLAVMWAAAAASGAVRAPGPSKTSSAGGPSSGIGGSDSTKASSAGGLSSSKTKGASVVVSGTALGLPGRDRSVFSDDNVDHLLAGTNFLDSVPQRVREIFPTLNLNRIDKGTGEDLVELPVTDTSGAIKLAGQVGSLDLSGDYGIDRDLASTMDSTARMAVAAGFEALNVAGIPLVQKMHRTRTGALLPVGWVLPEALQNETGVIFASCFPGLDRFAREMEAYHEHRIAGKPYEFDPKILFGILSMGHTQFAQSIMARGPNTQVNSACASTSVAVATACDWIRAGRCRRVVVIAADDTSSEHLLPWVGGGFLANGAAATDSRVSEAAIPFDERRHGLLVGAGATALVIEDEDEVAARGAAPLSRIVDTQISNSAYHGSRLNVDHVTAEVTRFVDGIEAITGIDRGDIADQMVFLSHETYTPARGGSADAEVEALRRAFGAEGARNLIIANTKGFTGHAMGVGFEDGIAPWILHNGQVPPIANLSQTDPRFADLNLSRGGHHDARWVLRFSAGFGSQVAMILMEKTTDNQKLIVDESLNRAWLSGLLGGREARLEVEGRVLHLVADQDRVNDTVSSVAAVAFASQSSGETRDLLAEVLTLVAEKTGYPEDMLDPEMDMEADLGIDTVKQAELFSAIRKTYAIPRQENLKLRDYPTINHVVGFVREFGTFESVATHESQDDAIRKALLGDTPSAAPPEPAPPTTAAPTRDLLAEVLTLVAEKTGYPEDMLDPEMDMEADLGIDTVKQAELFSEIRKSYQISRQENLKLRDYPTIHHVVGFVREFGTLDRVDSPALGGRGLESAGDDRQETQPPARPSVPPAAIVAGTRHGESSAAGERFDARVLVPKPTWLPPAKVFKKTGQSLTDGCGPVVLVGGGEVSDALRQVLDGRSVSVLDSGSVSQHEGPVSGLVIFDDVHQWTGLEELGAYCSEVVDWTVARFETVKALIASGRFDPDEGFVVGVTFMGGTLGYGSCNSVAPSGGALSGFVKAIRAEFPTSLAKVIDLDPVDDPIQAANLVSDEITSDPLTTEVGYRASQRWGITLVERDVPSPSLAGTLPERPVILVTGGAGGIMGEIAENLAGSLAARIVLTDIIEPGSEQAENTDRIINAIERVEAAGGTALYVQADVMDSGSVERAVRAAIARFGRIDAVLHGAGMEESRGLAKKSSDTFRRIVSIKVAGAGNLVSSVMNHSSPRSFLFFSSVAGRFGNAGQADYSAGNDFMTKLASHMSARHPEVRFTAVDWTAWDGPGMAGHSAIRAVLEDAGIEVLDRIEGAKIATRIIAGEDDVPSEVVVGKALGILEERLARAEGRRVVVNLSGQSRPDEEAVWTCGHLERSFTVDPAIETWLWDHAVDGTPVFPAVMGLHSFVETGQGLFGDRAATRFTRSEFRRAIKFFGGDARRLRVVLTPEDVVDGAIEANCVLDTHNRNKMEGGRLEHFEATIRFDRILDGDADAGRTVLLGRGEGLDLASRGWAGMTEAGPSDVYEHMFHGPGYQVLERFRHGGRRPEVGVGDLCPGDSIAPDGIYMLTELAMQTAGMWLLRSDGRAALPASIDSVHVMADIVAGTPHRAVSVYRGEVDMGSEGTHHVFDVTLMDSDSRTVLWLESVSLVETGLKPEARASAQPLPLTSPVRANRRG